jgi:hypothetical protein
MSLHFKIRFPAGKDILEVARVRAAPPSKWARLESRPEVWRSISLVTAAVCKTKNT